MTLKYYLLSAVWLYAATAYLIPNGGFESGSFAPWLHASRKVSPNATVKIVSPGYNSQYAVRLNTNTTQGFGNLYLNRLSVCPAKKYELSYMYKVPSASSNCSLTFYQTVNQPEGIIKQTEVIDLVQTDSWTKHSFVFNELTHDVIGLVFDLACDLGGPVTEQVHAELLMDDFQIEEVGSLEPVGCPKQQNFTNGGFDDGEFTPWIVLEANPYSNTSVISPGHNSPYMWEVQAWKGVQSKAQIGQFIEGFCIDYTYAVSFDYRFVGANTTESDCQFVVDIEDCSESAPLRLNSQDEEWHTGSFQCTMDEMGSRKLLRFNVRCAYYSHVAPFTAYLDNVKFGLATHP